MSGTRRPRLNGRLLIAIWLGCAAFAAPLAVGAVDNHQLSVFSPAASEVAQSPVPSMDVAPTTTPAAAPSSEMQTPNPSEPAGPNSVRLIVMFTAQGWSERAMAVESVGGAIESETPELRMAAVAVADPSVASALRADSRVAAVDQDRTRAAEGAPSDARFAEQWALPKIGWTSAYGSVAPAADVVVAVLDTGVDATHEDLAGRLVGGASYVDGADPDSDPNGHGTWMAGIVAAATDNSIGIAGVAWGGVRVMPVTVLDADGNGLDSNIIAGIVHATDSGADVVLLALSSRGYSPALQSAIDYAWSHDVVVVAAAGNDGSSVPAYPAADRGVVGVAATDQDDQLTSASNRGAAVFLAAPGADILTTDVGGGYTSIDGTSASAAIVAGAAAVMRSVEPGAPNGVIVARLARDAAPIANGAGAGNGRLNLARSLTDNSNVSIEPAGSAPNGTGGPFIGPYTAASILTWTGNGANANWTNAQNWGGTAPVAGDDLVFPTGAAQLTANNDFAAATAFNSITISGAGYTLTGSSVALGGGGLTASAVGATDTVSLALSFAADRTVTVTDAGTTLTVGSVVSGAGGLVKAGAGVLALSGTNTYTGTTTVGTGTVDVQSNAALGSATGTVVAAGASVSVTGSGLASAEPFTLNGSGISAGGALRNTANNNTLSGAITLASAATITSTSGTFTLSGAVTTAGFVVTYDGAGNTNKSAGAIAGTGGITKEGSGTLTFGVAHSYTGATTINNGTLKLGIANAIGASSAVNVAATGTFDLAGLSDSIGSLAGAGLVTSSAPGSVTLTTGSSNATTTFSGTLSDGSATVALTKSGSGTMTLSGTSSYSGVTRINAGILSIASDALLGTVPASATPGQLTFGGGTLQTTATFTLSANRGIAMTGVGTITTDPTTTLTYGGVIAGASALTKSGTGTLVLSGTNTYTAATAVSAGVLRVQSNAALGAPGTGTSVTSGAAIEVDGSGLAIAEPVTSLNGTGISAGGALRNLANSNTWSAAITMGTASRINSDSGVLTVGGVTGAGLTLTVGGAGSTTVGGVIGTTTGGLTKDGAGTVTLAGANTYTGATTVSVGTVKVGVTNAIGVSSAVTVASGAALDLGGFSDTIGSLAGAGSVTSSVAGAVTLTSGGLNTATTYSGVMSDGSGTVAMAKNGTGTLTLSGINTYSGSTTINAGAISIAADSGLGTAPASATAGQLTFNGGTLLVSATMTLNANRGGALSGAGTFSINSGVTLTYGGIIAGSSTLAKAGTGTLVLSGANSYSGSTTLTAGTLSISADSNLGTAPASPVAGQLTFGGASTLQTTTSFTLSANRGVALTAGATFTTDPSTTLTYGGTIAGASTLTKAGTGTFVLAGLNTYGGTSSVTVGVLRVQSSAALGATTAGTSVSSGAMVEIDGNGLSIAEPITSLSGTGVSNAGALRNLANDNTWSASIAMAASSRINSDAGTLTIAGVTGNTFTLTLGGAGNVAVGGAITTTTGALTKDGAGTAILNAASTYTGATTVSVGTLRLGISSPISAGSAVTVASGAVIDMLGTNQTLGSLAGAGSVTSSVAGAVTLTSGGLNTATTYSGVMSDGSGTVAMAKNGTGTLTLSGINTYTGSTTINAGAISIAADSGLGTAPASATAGQLTFNGGTLLVSATMTLNANRGGALSGAGTFSINSGVTLTYGGIIAGSSTLAKAGTGTLVLSGANSYSGSTTLTAGTLSISADSNLGTAPASPVAGQLTFAGGTLLVSANMTLDGDRGIALTGAGTISVNAAVSVGYSGIIAGSSTLAKAGTGTLTLSGANTYSGATTLSAGTLSISADSNLGTAPASPVAAQLTFNGGTLQATTSFSLAANRGVTLTGAATVLVDPSMTLSVPGSVVGASTLTKTGTGVLVLSGANTYGGVTTLTTGVLRVQSSSALGTTVGGTTIASGTAIEIDGTGLAIAEPVTSVIGTGISNAGALRNLANDNTWSGALTLGSGGARINSDAGTLTLSGGIGGATRPVTFGGLGNVTESNVIAITTGTLTKDGSGTLVLSAANTYTGATTISAGTLKLGISDSIPSGSALIVSASTTFDLSGFNDTVGSLAGGGGVTSTAAGSSTLTSGGNNTTTTFSGVVSDGSGTLALAKAGTGTLVLSGANSYSGSTTLTAGTLSISADSNLGTAPASPVAGQLTFGGGTLLVSANMTLDGDRGIALTGAGTISVNAAVSVGYSGIIAGSSTLAKAGTGTLTLSGANTYSGATTLSAGTLSISADSNLGTAPASPVAAQLTFNGGTLQATTSFSLAANRGVTLTGAATVLVDPSMTLSVPGSVVGASTLTKTGTGVLVLSGANTYGGVTTLTTGVLRVQSSSALGTTVGGTTIASGTAIEIDGTGLAIAEPVTSVIGTGISNAGALRNLANDNTWSGALTLGSGGARINSDAGTLTLSGGIGGATRPVTFGGLGNVTESNVIAITTGTLTKDGSGTLVLSAANTYTGATTISAGTLSISADNNLGTAPGSPTAGNVTISGGTLAVTATMTLTSTRGVSATGSGATFDVAPGTTLSYSGIETGAVPVTKTNGGAIDWSGATVTTGGLTIASGTVTAPSGTLSIGGDFINNSSSSAFLANGGTAALTGSVTRTLGGTFPLVLNKLTITNSAGIQLTNSVTVNAALTMSGGSVTTNGNLLYVSSTGSVVRTAGQVIGALTKYVPTGSPTLTFEVGDATRYTPAVLTFNAVASPGDVAVSTTGGDHPQLASSTIDSSLSVNRYWTLSGSALSFLSYNATLNFNAADVDGGSTTADFVVERYAASTWTPQYVSAANATSTTTTGLTAFGDLAIGEAASGALDHFTITAPASATAGTAVSVTVTAVDSVGNRVANYLGTVALSSSDAYATFSPSTYTFTLGDAGRKILTNSITFRAAGSQTASVADGATTGTSGLINVTAAAFTKLQIIVPGESSLPGSAGGRGGTPTAQTANAAFNVAVNAVDAYWNPVSATDTIRITSTDPLAALPPNAALVGGTQTFAVTLQCASSATVTATDVTNGARTADTSTAIPCLNTPPTVADDSYEMTADQTLTVAAPGILGNDTDAELQPITVGTPRPTSGPVHGSLTLNADGSFQYTPTGGYTGTDTFQYVANDGSLNSTPATVTIVVRDHSMISASGWDTSFDAGRYLSLTFPPYVASGATVTGATFHFGYRSLDGVGTTCYYIEVYSGAALIGTHGSAGSPLSCNGSGSYTTDDVGLSEVNSVGVANDVTVRVYMSNSAGARSQVNLGTLGVGWYLP